MRISSRLSIGSVIVLTILGVMILLALFAFQHAQNARRDELLIMEMDRALNQISVLQDEYLLRHEERAKTQWEAKIENVKMLLGHVDETITDISEKVILDEIREKFHLNIFLFSSLTEYLKNAGNTPKQFFSLEAERMLSQIIVNSYNLISVTDKLRETVKGRTNSTYENTTVIVIALMFLAVIITTVNYFSIKKTFSNRIAKLSEGAKIIGNGNLNHQIHVKGNDELASLARESNEMALKLKHSYTSIENLEREISGRKAAEQELREHEEHLEALVTERTNQLQEKATELETANQKLKELDHLKSMFIASMSHELRTPLNSIIGFTGIILQGMTGEINSEQKDQLQRVYGSAKHLLALISDVIDISKIEAGTVAVNIDEFDFEGVVKEAVSSLKQEIDNKGLCLEISLIPDLRLKTDRKRLLQCILNFLSNAVKFTEKGTIWITTSEIDGMIEIRLKDTGIGMKKEDMPRLFESFMRLDSPLKIKTQGTGLGLYLTRKIAIEQLGGSVYAESTYGEGSTFILRIPK